MTQITRRALLAAGGSGLLRAQRSGGFHLGDSRTVGDTTLLIIPAEPDGFAVGILREKDTGANAALVRVFYEVRTPDMFGPLLLNKSSHAPVVPGVTCVADDNFILPLADVRLIRVTLMKEIAVQEFR